MRIVKANKPVLFLGMKGEDRATQVRFPVATQWRQIYGEGVFALAFLRPTEVAPYACVIGEDGDDVTWDITSTEVAIVGDGKAELLYFVDGALAKSATYMTHSVDSITAVEGDPPEPWESWIEDVLAAGSQAQQAAEQAETAASDAEASATTSEQKAGEAEESATDAENAAQRAETAAEAANTAVAGITMPTFGIDENGYLYINHATALGNIKFSLNYQTGNLEEYING